MNIAKGLKSRWRMGLAAPCCPLSHFLRIFHEQGAQERPNLSLCKHFTAHTSRPGQTCLLHYLPKVHVTSHYRQQEY